MALQYPKEALKKKRQPTERTSKARKTCPAKSWWRITGSVFHVQRASKIFRAFVLTYMPGVGTTKDENHPHPSLPRRGGGIQGGGAFSYKAVTAGGKRKRPFSSTRFDSHFCRSEGDGAQFCSPPSLSDSGMRISYNINIFFHLKYIPAIGTLLAACSSQQELRRTATLPGKGQRGGWLWRRIS